MTHRWQRHRTPLRSTKRQFQVILADEALSSNNYRRAPQSTIGDLTGESHDGLDAAMRMRHRYACLTLRLCASTKWMGYYNGGQRTRSQHCGCAVTARAPPPLNIYTRSSYFHHHFLTGIELLRRRLGRPIEFIAKWVRTLCVRDVFAPLPQLSWGYLCSRFRLPARVLVDTHHLFTERRRLSTWSARGRCQRRPTPLLPVSHSVSKLNLL